VTSVDEEIGRLPDHVTYGPGAVHELPAIVEGAGAGRVLLVCGRRSFEASGAADVLPALERLATVTRWSDFAPNTDADDLARGLEVLREADADLVLAVGGGSAMDMAKLLCAYQHLDGGDVTEAIRAGARVEHRDLGLVLVPTTSGSGAETTHFAVVYIGHDKHSIAGPAMLPDRIVLDPELTRSGSDYQRATSGIDAVCQAIESLWAVGATDESRDHARRGLALGLAHLEDFVREPGSEAAAGMALASHLAGRAIDVSKTTAAHALSYGLTKRHGISHGHAVATTLGAFIESHAAAGPEDLQPSVEAQAHETAMAEVLTQLGASDASAGRDRFVALLHAIGLEPRLARLGVDAAELPVLADTVNTERLGNNPVRLDTSQLAQLLSRSH
jgi:alcohol dehydrogenase